MYKLLLSILLLSFVSLTNTFSQCVPNTTITTPGIYPDSATGLAVGVVGQPYSQVLQVRVPLDTMTSLGRKTIVNLQLLSLTALPPGLTYACLPTNCTFPGNSNGCVIISGTPTLAGVFFAKGFVKGTVLLGVGSLTQSQTDSLNYYSITINNTATGLAQQGSSQGFSIGQNSPNPYNDFTTINYSVPSHAAIDFRVFNMIGKEVYHKQQDSDAGQNSIRLDGRDFAPGVYMYTVTYGAETLTKRMVISRK
jgi:hypothetical protein